MMPTCSIRLRVLNYLGGRCGAGQVECGEVSADGAASYSESPQNMDTHPDRPLILRQPTHQSLINSF